MIDITEEAKTRLNQINCSKHLVRNLMGGQT